MYPDVNILLQIFANPGEHGAERVSRNTITTGLYLGLPLLWSGMMAWARGQRGPHNQQCYRTARSTSGRRWPPGRGDREGRGEQGRLAPILVVPAVGVVSDVQPPGAVVVLVDQMRVVELTIGEAAGIGCIPDELPQQATSIAPTAHVAWPALRISPDTPAFMCSISSQTLGEERWSGPESAIASGLGRRSFPPAWQTLSQPL